MNLANVSMLALLTLGAASCSTMDRAARVNPASASARPSPIGDDTCNLTSSLAGDQELAIDLGCFKFQPKTSATAKGDDLTAYQMANQTKVARNRLEAVLINHANIICENEKGRIYARRAATSGMLDFLSSSFAITSTIVGGEQAKSILAGLAGLSTATRTNIDANVYQNQIVSAITKVMDAERKSILSTMEAKRTSSLEDYPVDEMIRLANTYHQGCSFQKGVELLLDAAVNKEGADSIIEGLNLASAQKNLAAAIQAQRAIDPGDTQGKIPDMIKAHAELVLKQKANTDAAQSVTTE